MTSCLHSFDPGNNSVMFHDSRFGFVSREVSYTHGSSLCLQHAQDFLGMDKEELVRVRGPCQNTGHTKC